MRAVVHDRYGPPEVLRVEEIPRPVPEADQVLVRVHASTVTQTDCHMRRARPYIWRLMLGLRRPKRRVLGLELAGVVEAVGSAVTSFQPGDRVFGMRSGAHAEFVCVRESGYLGHMPTDMTFEEGAAVSDGANQALSHLKRAKVGTGNAPARLRGVGVLRHGRGAAREAPLRRARDGRLHREEHRADAVARRGRGDRLRAGGLHDER